MMQPFSLLGRASSINVRKVLWTCLEIGLVHTFDDDCENGRHATRRAELLALNPNLQFPVLPAMALRRDTPGLACAAKRIH